MSSDDQGPGDDFPVFDEEWINDATKREASADDRAERYRRIAEGHQRMQAQREQDRMRAEKTDRRSKLRPWLVFGGVVLAVFILWQVF